MLVPTLTGPMRARLLRGAPILLLFLSFAFAGLGALQTYRVLGSHRSTARR